MSHFEDAQIQTIQAVVDRVGAYHDGATEGTVEDELRKGFGEAGVEVSAEQIDALAVAIHDNNGDVSAEEVLA